MKTKKMTKALLSVALVAAMLMSMCIVGFTGVSAAGLELNYEFAYNNAGYAEGRLSLSGESGTYILYWADETGALEGYTGIAQITLNSGKKYFEMPANTAIPAGATKVIAVESNKEATVENASAVFEIPESKQFKGGTKQYSFEALSDIHIQFDDSYWYLSKPHFANALEVAAERDVDFMTICGDMVNGYDYNNLKKEYPQYLELIAKSNYNNPIYETNGNHEMKGGSAAQNLDLYREYTGLNATTGTVGSVPYYEKTINGDHYIFLVLEISGSPNESSEFTQTQLDWFEGLLKKYYNDGHKIIVNQHALIRGYGAGDNKVTPYYGGHLQQSYADVKRLMSLMEAYPDIIMMSGHSHIDFKYGYNFDNENGKTCYTVHIPSTSSTTHPNAGGTGLADYKSTMHANSSQGYLVDVYEDYVVFNGTDLAFNLICPSYTYMVDYTGEELDKNELEDIVYDTVNVTVDVSNLTDAPQSVVCVAVDESNSANNQSVPMTKNADGTYSAKIIADFTSFYFAINGATGVKTSAFPVSNCKVILGYQTLNYSPDNAVSFVRAHVWGDGGDGTTWPGTTMTKSGDSYTARIPASDYTGVVFNWGDGDSNKSSDLKIADYITDRVDDVYINLDGDTTEPSTEATTKATEATTEATEVTATVATEPTEATTEATEATTEATEPTETTVVTETTEPTETTEIPTSTPDETTVPTTVTEPTTETTAPAVEYFYGDADLNEKINVKDATQVQKHTAKMLTLEGQALTQADVTGDGKVNIKDATAIQKYVAKLITIFPVEEGVAELAAVGASAALMTEVKGVLSKEYQYASYDAYMALKKAYMNNVSDDELNKAYTDYKTMRGKNPLANPGGTVTIGDIDIGQTGTGSPTIPGPSYINGGNSGGNTDNPDNPGGDTDSFTVYAINSAKWDTMVAHAWNTGGSGTTWPGTVMTKTAETVNGFDVYSATFSKEYGNIIFNNNDNGAQTADLEFQSGKYFDVKGGKWYESLDEVPAVSAASTDRYLVGEFNSWSTTANEFMAEDGSVGYVELELEANTTYEFKIVREGAWTSCKTTLSITDSTSGLVFSSSVSDNTTITTKSAGTYVFAFGLSTSQLSVTYP